MHGLGWRYLTTFLLGGALGAGIVWLVTRGEPPSPRTPTETGTGDEPPLETRAPVSVEGHVTDVNGREGRIGIDRGTEHGVAVGDKLIVSRGSSYVTTIEVTSVEPGRAVGQSIIDMQKSLPRVGDAVMSR